MHRGIDRGQRVLRVLIVGTLLLGGNAEASFFQSTGPAALTREIQTLRSERGKKPPSRFAHFVMRLLDELQLPRP